MVGRTVSFFAAHKYIVYALFTIITIFTLYLTLIPLRSVPGISLFEYNKLGHFLMFFGWTFMLGFSFIIRNNKLAPLFRIFLAGMVFGISIEFAQELLPYGRTASVWDAAADVAGSFVAVLLLWGIQTRYQSYLKPALIKNNINNGNTLES
ncbi:hypothetical protein DYD21_17730 [Rhodohalobacter sp. SW132]|uniref:VanZ family protein n=1 Tax=Rhodohalobacter sp. SW132 TaxID=2293433 RepID=UPI000E25A27E|nr:VanZ family protein [Rhodohalobacter sp. SW132]REL24695.1 hypothetical protein DYD21_17730 [Rhodohalobacter sp. SW132]